MRNEIQAMRDDVRSAFQNVRGKRDGSPHAGLLFSRGLANRNDHGDEGGGIAGTVGLAARQPVPAPYRHAYHRWLGITSDALRFARWFGALEGRLFLGLGGAQVLETNVTLNRTFGVPLLPGSALKGLARAHAKDYGLDPSAAAYLFGTDTDDPHTGDAGYLIFHDAWWVPDSAATPLVGEVATVHHTRYYATSGRMPATDFDAPNPNPQLAAKGSFLISVEGNPRWASLGLEILRHGLIHEGLGGKVTLGYGRFQEQEDARALGEGRKLAKVEERRTMDPAQRLHAEIGDWDERQLAEAVGKRLNKTCEEMGIGQEELMKIVAGLHGALIAQWANEEKGSNKLKVFKKMRDFLSG